MNNLVIVTNNVPRDTIYWHDLTPKEWEDFDYLETEDERVSATFFRYRGNAYNLSEFFRTNWVPEFAGWHGYAIDGYFSGVLIRFVDDGERIICGRYCQ